MLVEKLLLFLAVGLGVSRFRFSLRGDLFKIKSRVITTKLLQGDIHKSFEA
jgi:hypothetical protein